MQYKYVIGYLRLSQDDEDKNDESNSIKNQRLLIQQFINGNEEFQGAKTVFFSDDGYSGTNFIGIRKYTNGRKNHRFTLRKNVKEKSDSGQTTSGNL